jgi:hypothetical protein
MSALLPMLDVAALAAEGAQLLLDECGRPVEAGAFVDLDEADALGDDLLRRAVEAAGRTQRVLVGIASAPPQARLAPLLESLTCSVLPEGRGPAPRTCVTTDDRDAALAAVSATVTSSPQAATVLVALLRLTASLPVPDGVVAESLAYSMLLTGEEFGSWRRARPVRRVPEALEPAVLCARDGAALSVVLNRPARRNAYGREMRDGLVEALEIAVVDPGVERVVLRGAGRAFCSGGDLDEFGSTRDVIVAHNVRLERNAGLLLHRLRERVVVEVHGACVGAGVELPSFASRVVAADDAWFQLPELQMGLVPGAGGTVSVSGRIGRWRTAWLALTGRPVEVATALAWGLVDARA